MSDTNTPEGYERVSEGEIRFGDAVEVLEHGAWFESESTAHGGLVGISIDTYHRAVARPAEARQV